MRVRVIAALTLLLAGCAAGVGHTTAPHPELDDDRELTAREHDELVRASEEADRLASAHDCSAACEAGARVCDLADRICTIAARHEGDRELEERCDDGHARCSRASARLTLACGCAPRSSASG